MLITNEEKNKITDMIAEKISGPEVKKLILFGSFVESANPNEINLAIISEENLDYISKVAKYRKKIKDLSKKIPVQIFPLLSSEKIYLHDKIKHGVTLYSK